MTNSRKIEVLAKMDGRWKDCTRIGGCLGETCCCHTGTCDFQEEYPDYLNSYDAIISLIHKKLNRYTCHSFFDALGLEAIKDWQDVDFSPSYEGDGSYFEMWVCWKATPIQLCDALIKAAGQWEEE